MFQFLVLLLLAAPCLCTSANADDAQIDFFEKRIRPVLIEHCYKCHSADTKSPKGQLRLDTATASRAGGESGPAIVPGNPEDSLLLSALKYESFEMPPKQRLPAVVIADFEKWIRAGAFDPRKKQEPNHPHTPSSAGPDLEAGRKFWAFQQPVTSPSLKNDMQNSSRIDALVERKLHDVGLSKNSRASRRTLIRRLSFAITGLPPTYEQVNEFENDSSDTALTTVVDQLLDSPAYGQRWARLWLDVSRYAEDQAHIVGNNKSLFYPDAFRYRDWVIDSLNADMPYDRFVKLQLAVDLLEPDNTADRPALGFIGLGPKYYRRNDPEVMAEEWEDRVDVVSRGLQALTVACARCHDHKYDPIATEDYYALAGVFASSNMHNHPLEPKPTAADKSDKNKSKKKKAPGPQLHIVKDGKPRDLNVMIRGKVDRPGNLVPRGFIEVVFNEPRRRFKQGSGRAELAESIADRANPLTARVIVNRVWKEFFGRGIVNTPSNFGQLGERPTHSELLDDLSVRFMDNGWSLKWLQRQIVLSQTYQRSSKTNAKALQIDPQNKLLWRMPRRKLSVEAWRDAVLAVAGKLDIETGGPSIRPDDPREFRRTIYSAVSRFDLNPLLARFDFPDPNVHCASRAATDTPLQKLFLLNNPFMLAQSSHVAERVETTASDQQQRVRQLFKLAYQRPPDEAELVAVTALLAAPEADLKQVAHSIFASNEFWYLD